LTKLFLLGKVLQLQGWETMLKLLVTAGLAAVLIIFIIAAVLAWFNWSEKLWMPVITAGLVGTITGVLSILSGLQGVSTSESFATSVAVDKNTGSTLAVFSSPGFERKVLRQFAVGSLLTNGEKPANAPDPTSPLLEALQYLAVRLISENRGGSLTSMASGTASAQLVAPAPDADLVDYPHEQLVRDFPRFVNLPNEAFWWRIRKLQLPRGTNLKPFHVPSSPETGAERQGIRLIKPMFFTVEIQFETLGTATGLTEGLSVSEGERLQAGSFFAKATIKSDFERLTAGNRRTEQYKQWVRWLSEHLRARLAD
jgi:hypothetical protein